MTDVFLNDAGRFEVAFDVQVAMASLVVKLRKRVAAVDGGGGYLPVRILDACEEIAAIDAEVSEVTGKTSVNGNLRTRNETLNEWIPTQEAAARIGKTTRRITGLCAAGELKAKLVGRFWLIDPVALDDYRRAGKKGRQRA